MAGPTGPEAAGAAVQDPPGDDRPSVADDIASAIDSATKAAGTPDPEADGAASTGLPDGNQANDAPPPGDGDKPPGSDAGDDPPSPAAWLDSASELDWSDEGSRQKFIDGLLKEQQGVSDTASARSLSDQRRNLTADLTRSNDQRAAHEALLVELDDLEESDPDAWNKRIKSDQPAARAIFLRNAEQNVDPIATARISIARESVSQMMEALPHMETYLEKIATKGEDALRSALDPAKGGLYLAIDTAARDDAVSKYKQSAAFQKDMEAAAERAVHDAAPGRGGGTPPPQTDSQPGGTARPGTTGDDLKDAVAAAAADLGTEIDITKIKTPMIPGARRS